MDRITHQSPRQQGYGSTSGLRNDSLTHTRKHERKEGGIEPKSRAARLWRTVRPGRADCPHGPRGLSAKVPRTIRTGTADCPAWTADCPKKPTEPPVANPENGPSAGSTRTVCQAPADCPCLCCRPSETSSNQNSKPKWIESKDKQEHEEHSTNTALADRPPQPRGLSAPQGQRQKLLDPKVNSPNSSPDLPNGRLLYPKNFAS
jgi:hypothetical protein